MATVVVVALVVVAACGGLWFSNTSTIDIVDAGRTLSGSPGDTLSFELPDSGCFDYVTTFRRKGLFGRWQQTHVGQEPDIVPWYRVGGGERAADTTSECATQFTITIPADVTWSPVAACSADVECFVIDVVSADGDGGAGG